MDTPNIQDEFHGRSRHLFAWPPPFQVQLVQRVLAAGTPLTPFLEMGRTWEWTWPLQKGGCISGGFIENGVPKSPWLSVLEWSDLGWFWNNPILGILHILLTQSWTANLQQSGSLRKHPIGETWTINCWICATNRKPMRKKKYIYIYIIYIYTYIHIIYIYPLVN